MRYKFYFTIMSRTGIVCLGIILIAGLASCASPRPASLPDLEVSTLTSPGVQDLQLVLTPEEKAWLAKHPTIRMGVERNYPPYEFTDNQGNFTGISADYRNLVSKRLGLEIQVEQFANFSIIRDKIDNKELDVVLLLTPTTERKEFLLFTQPFFEYQLVIVTRDDHPVVFGLGEFKGKKVAIVEGYASSEYVSKEYPELGFVPYPTVEDGLLAVSTGKADALVSEVFATVYQIRQKSIGNVKIAASIESDLPGYAVGVRDDWPELVAILNKALATITPEERLQISNKWLSVKYEQGFDYSLLWKILAGGLLVLGVFVYWNRRLSSEVAIRKQMEGALRESEKRYRLLFERSASAIAIHEVIYDTENRPCGYRFLDVNPTFEQLTGLEHEQVIGQDVLAILPGIEQIWIDLYNRVSASGKQAFFEQYVTPLDRCFQGIVYIPQPGQFAVSFMDITERKWAEDELRKHQQHLEELVKERTTDLEAKNVMLANEIIERKRAQQELEESEANFRAIAENASDAILIASGSGDNLLFANHRAEEISGYATGELHKIGLEGLLTPNERRRALEFLGLRLDGKPAPIQYETVFLHKSTLELPIEMTADAIHWQGQLASLVIARDITERKKREAEIIEQNYELEVLTNISTSMRQIDTPADMASLTLDRLIDLLDMSWGVLAILDGDRLAFLAEQNLPCNLQTCADAYEDEFQRIIISGDPRYISDVPKEMQPVVRRSVDSELPWMQHSCVMIPLKSFDNVIGIIAAFCHEPRMFTPQMRRLVAAIAEIAGNAIERRRTMTTLEERVADRTRDLSALYQIMTVANQPVKLGQFLEQTLNIVLKALNCPVGCVWLQNPEDSSLKLSVAVQTNSMNLCGLVHPAINPTLTEEIITKNKPLLITDISTDSRVLKSESMNLNGEVVGIPLHAGGRVLGILWSFSSQTGHLALEDVSLLMTIGERIGTTIENIRLRERTQQLAILEERQRLARDLHELGNPANL